MCRTLHGSAHSTRNDSKGIVNEVEHILVYSKEPEWNPNKLPPVLLRWMQNIKIQTMIEPFGELITLLLPVQPPIRAWSTPSNIHSQEKMLYPSNGACWRYQQDTMLEIMNGWTKYELQDLHDEKERAHVCGISPDEVRPDVKSHRACRPVGSCII